MKGAIVLSILMACVTVGYGRGLCDTEADCAADECCVAANVVQLLYKGVCRRLGRPGSPCNTEDVQLNQYDGKYLSRCPCQDAGSCESTGRYRNGDGNNLQIYLSQRCQRVQGSPVANSSKNSTSSNITDGNNSFDEIMTEEP